jgi:glycosyltransferase involved in cell wall biosynthesis
VDIARSVDSGQKGLVSVIMNCFNGENYLREAIDSVLAQTYQNLEIVFWDNQSSDRSAEIFKSYTDPRLKYFYAPKHTWLYEARNYAIAQARGEFIAFLDVDDWWHPDKLEQQIPLFRDAEVGFVCANFWVRNEVTNKEWKWLKRQAHTGWVLDELLKFYYVGMLTLVVRRSALNSLDYVCNPQYHIIGDFDLVIRLAIRWKMDCVHDPVARYRLHESNESGKHHSRHVEELTSWCELMMNHDAIKACPNSRFVRQQVTYLKAKHKLLSSDRRAAFDLLRELPWGLLKLKLWVRVILGSSALLPRIRRNIT